MVTPLLALLLRNYPEEKGQKAVGEKQAATVKSGDDYASAIKSTVFYALIAFAFLMISVSTINLFLLTYVVSVGYSVEQSAFVASAIMLGVTIGKVALGWLNDKSPRYGILASVGSGIVGFGFLLLGKSGIAIMTGGGFLFGWAYAGVTVETALLVRTVFGGKDYAKIFSNIAIALAAGGTLMAGAWGYLADLIDFKSILTIGMMLLAVSGILGFYALRKSKQGFII